MGTALGALLRLGGAIRFLFFAVTVFSLFGFAWRAFGLLGLAGRAFGFFGFAG